MIQEAFGNRIKELRSDLLITQEVLLEKNGNDSNLKSSLIEVSGQSFPIKNPKEGGLIVSMSDGYTFPAVRHMRD